jgi:hypothetical protein
MDWASWSASLDQFLHSPNLPMWAAIAAAALVALIVVISLLRADRSVANGALVVITLVAIGLAGFASYRGINLGRANSDVITADRAGLGKAAPALACVDDLAGDLVQAACEKALFGSPELVAAAVSYASARLARLTALGDVAAADKQMTPDLARLRRSIERDRYGLVAYVLAAQDHCQANDCAAYRSLTDHSRIAANMNDHVYETMVKRYAPTWGLPGAATAAAPPAAATAPVLAGVTETPTGKPTDIDYPTSASIPPVSIMTAEPPPPAKPAQSVAAPAHGAATANGRPHASGQAASHQAQAQAPAAAKRPPMAAQASATNAAPPAAAKRPPTPPKPKPAAPMQLAPEEANPDN